MSFLAWMFWEIGSSKRNGAKAYQTHHGREMALSGQYGEYLFQLNSCRTYKMPSLILHTRPGKFETKKSAKKIRNQNEICLRLNKPPLYLC